MAQGVRECARKTETDVSLTGQVIERVVQKTGPRAREQGEYLLKLGSCSRRAVVPVLRLLEDGYTMPELFPVDWEWDARWEVINLEDAIVNSRKSRYEHLGIDWRFDPTKLLTYLNARCSNEETRQKLQRFWEVVSERVLALDDQPCQHGDLTWENAMCTKNGDVVLIDALPPGDGTLPAPLADAGKLYVSSLRGWGVELIPAEFQRLGTYASIFNTEEVLVRFSAVTHLLRVLPYALRARHATKLAVIEENLSGLLLDV